MDTDIYKKKFKSKKMTKNPRQCQSLAKGKRDRMIGWGRNTG